MRDSRADPSGGTLVSGSDLRRGLRALLLASLLSACTSSASEPGGVTTTASVSIDNESCRTTPTPPENVPPDVRAWLGTSDIGVLGNGGLWSVIPDASWLEPRQDAASGKTFYDLKLAWYRQNPGRLEVSAIRIDNMNHPEWASVSVRSGYGDSGFQPSGIIFASAGCWRIVGHLAGSIELTHFLFLVP